MALAASAVLFLAVLELLLQIAPGLVSQQARNAMLTRAIAVPGGIFYRVDELGGMLFQRPDLTVSTYWNGYRWRHSTDRFGFRNPPRTSSDVVLLGDSMIYGHGVEEEETVAHDLRVEAGWPAYNMARQGDTLFQSYVLFRLYVDLLQPEEVILFSFLNDVWELGEVRSDEELRTVPEIDRVDYEKLRRRLPAIEARGSSYVVALLLRSRALRLLAYEARRLLASAWLPRAWAAGSAPGSGVPPYVAVLDDPVRFEQAMGYYRLVLADLEHRCDERGIDLRIVYLNVPWVVASGLAGQDRLDAALAEIAASLAIPYASTRGWFDGCTACLLPNDGHFSAEGHQRLARFLIAHRPQDSSHPLHESEQGAAASPGRSGALGGRSDPMLGHS